MLNKVYYYTPFCIIQFLPNKSETKCIQMYRNVYPDPRTCVPEEVSVHHTHNLVHHTPGPTRCLHKNII